VGSRAARHVSERAEGRAKHAPCGSTYSSRRVFRPTNRPLFVSFASLSQHREPHSPACRRYAFAPFGSRARAATVSHPMPSAQPLGMRPGFEVQNERSSNCAKSTSETKGEIMKAVDLLKALGVVVCVAVASSAYAQSSDAAATSTESAAPTKAQKSAVKKEDRKLGYSVRRALSKAQGFDVSNVFVRARSGAITLTGTVPESGQIAQAEEVAKGVAGVKSVSNKITLGVQGGGG
jgi:hyperosmotically inducible periplasmic protein